MRVAIVENTAVTHHGQVGVALAEAGALIDIFRPFADGRLPEGGYAGIVVFGGEQSALDDRIHPYLPALAARLRATDADGVPVLGICLGAQVLARAWGAENRLGTAPEFGWAEIALTDAGAADPVMGALPRRFRAFQWHADTFTLPPGAVHLAAGAAVPMQAFRAGRASWGMQFHFEANRAVVADWTRRYPAQAEAMAPGWAARHASEAAAHGAAADAAGLALARAWVAQVAARA
jgi:GMP synthase-like glutamine amidotransferase